MTTAQRHIRVIREPIETTIRRLETFVGRMEHRYECKSSVMLDDVTAGRQRETAEIARWLTDYETLTNLREQFGDGRTTGTPTSSTR